MVKKKFQIDMNQSRFCLEVVQVEDPMKTLDYGRNVELGQFDRFQSHNSMSY